MKAIEDIIGKRGAQSLRKDFNEIIMTGRFDQVEDLMLEYGLEMDYVEQLMW